MTILYIVLISLGVIALLVLGTVLFCIHTAKKVLHPISKRKPLDAWPDQFKLPYENVTFRTEDKVQLKGWFIPAPEESEKTIILMHGWGMNRADILKNTYFLHDLGFNLFYFDFRALGESGGKTSSIGYLELKDITAAISFLKETLYFGLKTVTRRIKYQYLVIWDLTITRCRIIMCTKDDGGGSLNVPGWNAEALSSGLSRSRRLHAVHAGMQFPVPLVSQRRTGSAGAAAEGRTRPGRCP